MSDFIKKSDQQSIQVGDVVNGLGTGSELVRISKIETVGSRLVVEGILQGSQKAISRPLTQDALERLRIVSRANVGYTYDGDAKKFLSGVEAMRIKIAYQYDPLFAVSSSIVDPLPHQVEAVYHYLLPLHRIRFLLGDDTGAGKTIMAGLLLKELMYRGTIERVLIVTPGGLTKQWQEDEMQGKFGFNFELIDRARFSSSPNVFNTASLCITSIDFIRQEDVTEALKSARWDMVIVDEAHKLSAYDYGSRREENERYKAIKELSEKTEHLLLLTATPHRGRKDTFRYLLQLLDRDLFQKDEHVNTHLRANQQEDAVEKINKARNKFFLRRLKEDMVDWAGEPLFKPRHTKTCTYELTPEELELYQRVTDYVRARKKEAKKKKNMNVELALMVMQRRLTSSLRAITRTLENRLKGLQDVLQFIEANQGKPDVIKKYLEQNQGAVDDVNEVDDFDELDDSQRNDIEKRILRNTLTTDPKEIQKEINELDVLVKFAHTLDGQDEAKYVQLKALLDQDDIMRSEEKLVIFTEYKDTLDYLQERMEASGYSVCSIHGGMNVDQRKEAQRTFLTKSQIMIATDAAGEGINLQFCRFLINWDIPWNPNRLEQRMGRIHRYGQKDEVYVYNLVASNTREGSVMEKILTKLDIMREQLGTDRVYDVISDLLEDFPLAELIQEAMESESVQEHDAILRRMDGASLEERAKKLTDRQSEQALITEVRWRDVRGLKDASDERRLQPLYVQNYFLRAFRELGGEWQKDERTGVYRLSKVPIVLRFRTENGTRTVLEKYDTPFVFDKLLLSPQSTQKLPDRTRLLGPGHELFDAVLEIAKRESQESLTRGVTLIDPSRKEPAWAWIVKSTITDAQKEEPKNIADQNIAIAVFGVDMQLTSPAYLLDTAPAVAAVERKDSPKSKNDVIAWAFDAITDPQLEHVRSTRKAECDIRDQYLRGAFQDLIVDLTEEVNELDRQETFGDDTSQERQLLEERILELKQRKEMRLREVEDMMRLEATTPEIVSSALLIPLTREDMEDEAHHAFMHRDDEVERIAIQVAMDQERSQGRVPKDVGAENLGYDICSIDPADDSRRYIEVKGRADSGAIMLSENEYTRLRQLADKAWLYIVTNCKTLPNLHVIQSPGSLKYHQMSKGVQYLLDEKDWRMSISS
jgi:superfamily II DNA or RNA helicase